MVVVRFFHPYRLRTNPLPLQGGRRFQLILKATDAKTVRTVVIVHVGVVAVEVQVATVDAIYRTGPVVAVAACVVERTIIVVTVTRHNKQTDKHFTPSNPIIFKASVLE